MNIIESLHVDNFRSLWQFHTDLRPFSVFIGRNDAGKTTIIKALQLLLNDNATQSVDRYDWSRAANAPHFPRHIQLTGQIRTETDSLQIRRLVTIFKDQAAESVLQVQRDNTWHDITPESALQLPVLYYLKPRTGALQEAFDPKTENNIFSLVKEWMPSALSKERDLHKLMRDYAPKENNLTAYVKFFQEKVLAQLQVAFPSDFPLLQLNPDFRTPDDRGRLFVRESKYAEAKQSIFRLPLDHHGTGLISIVAIVLSVEVLREHHRQNSANKPLIFAIEEPEVHLHSQAQRTLLNYLKWLSQEYQTIVSTHSPLFVDRTDPQNVYVVKRATLRDEKAATKGRIPWKAGTTNVMGDAYRDTWQAVHDTLGMRLSDALMAGEFNLLVEGPTEEVLLPALARVWAELPGNTLDFDRVLIVGCGGTGDIPNMVRLFLGTGNSTAVLVDGDEAGHIAAEKIKKDKLSVDFVHELGCQTLPPPLNTLPECEFEDHLDPQVLLRAFNKRFSGTPGHDYLPIGFDEFQRERQHLMGQRKSFGWIATVESLLKNKLKAAEPNGKFDSPKVDKRRLAEAAAEFVIDGSLSVPEFCDDLFRRIQMSLRSYM